MNNAHKQKIEGRKAKLALREEQACRMWFALQDTAHKAFSVWKPKPTDIDEPTKWYDERDNHWLCHVAESAIMQIELALSFHWKAGRKRLREDQAYHDQFAHLCRL